MTPHRLISAGPIAIAAVLTVVTASASLLARPPVPAAAMPSGVARLVVYPASFRLTGPNTSQRLLVTAVSADGSERDVTEAAIYRASDEKKARVSASGIVSAAAGDASTVIIARYGGREARANVQFVGMGKPFTPSFTGDVVPTLARLGCSQGTCHGAAAGKGGFRLSLRGYAPEQDWVSITRQLSGRRISPENPARSLFLRKPLGEVAHRGGKIFDATAPEYRLLLAWLEQGAIGPREKEPALAKLSVFPDARRMRPADRQRLTVRATYTDGRSEDVTSRALFQSNDLTTATVDEDGLVTQQRAGDGSILVKYRDKMTVARFVAPFAQTVSPQAFGSRRSYIDDLVNAKLADLHIEPSGRCTDAEFLRRAYVDAIGTLPTEAEAAAFLGDKRPDKRDRLVNELLQRPEYGMVWALKFGDLFVLRKEYLGRKNAMLLQQWLTDQFNANRPWDKITSDILTATGDPNENRPALYFVSRTPQKENERYWIRKTENTAEMTAQVFLGARIGCAKCHNHPTEKYTQDDYYHFVALWHQVTGKGTRDGVIPERLEATSTAEIRQPRTNQVMTPQPLDRSRLGFVKGDDQRVKTVQWMVKQPEFARNIVNRYWARCFGQGIISPVDDVRSTNPATNEPLMNALCADFVKHGCDLKHLLATIMKSETYQRTSQTGPTNRIDTKYFSHYYPRRMNAEELVDAVAQVTGVPDKFERLTPGTRALELADTEIPSVMLDTFGRPPRVQPSEGERNCNPTVSQALALLNSDAVQEKLRSPESVLPALLKSGKTDRQLVEELYLRALSRRPTASETAKVTKYLKTVPNRDEGYQDVLWALLNTKDFLFVY